MPPAYPLQSTESWQFWVSNQLRDDVCLRGKHRIDLAVGSTIPKYNSWVLVLITELLEDPLKQLTHTGNSVRTVGVKTSLIKQPGFQADTCGGQEVQNIAITDVE